MREAHYATDAQGRWQSVHVG